MLRMLTCNMMLAGVALAGLCHTALGVDPIKTGAAPLIPTSSPYVLPTTPISPLTSTSSPTFPEARERLLTTDPYSQGISPQLLPNPGMPSRGPRWRLGVYSQDTNTGVKILRVVQNSPADRAGLEPNDLIVAVAGYQVGIVNGQQYDCGYEFERHADSQGNCMLLVFDSRQGMLVNLPIQLESRLAKITGTIAYRNRIFLPPNAVATVELREAYAPATQGITLGQQQIDEIRQIPIPFEIEYDPGDINLRKNYIVTATITSNGRPLYTTVQQYPVNLTSGRPQTASIEVERASTTVQTAASDDRAQIEQQIRNYFRAYFGREPRPEEMPLWTAQVTERGRSLFDIQADIAANERVWSRCEHDQARYIELLHEAVLGKKPTQEELYYWLDQYEKSGGLRRVLAEDLLTAAGVPR